MNDTRTRSGPDPRFLLLIPAVLIIAKAGRRRREMMERRWDESGPRGPRSYRLPPPLESALDAWHTRTHEASDSNDPELDPGTTTV